MNLYVFLLINGKCLKSYFDGQRCFLYSNSVCVEVHSHTVITHHLKVFMNSSYFSLWLLYMVQEAVCVCPSSFLWKELPSGKKFFFLSPCSLKEKKDLLLWSLVRAFLVLTPPISNKKVHLSTKPLLLCADFTFKFNLQWIIRLFVFLLGFKYVQEAVLKN